MFNKPKIIFLNHKEKACGVYQYGYRSSIILQKSEIYDFIYTEVESEIEFFNAIKNINPIGIVYNYHSCTMGWLNIGVIKQANNIIHYGLAHDSIIDHIGFNYILFVDSTSIDIGNGFSIPRPLLENTNHIIAPTTTTISSFGFGFEHKGFERVVKIVNQQFDNAIIKLHISTSFYGDKSGAIASEVSKRCFAEMYKENIKLIITNDFLTDNQLIEFLASSTINIFLYDQLAHSTYGLSSVIDYALSVDTPIAISRSNMFRHIRDASPSICIENRSIIDIINSGNAVLQPYKNKWSHSSFVKKYEYIISSTYQSSPQYSPS
jgi:hypothetical protein